MREKAEHPLAVLKEAQRAATVVHRGKLEATVRQQRELLALREQQERHRTAAAKHAD